MALLQLVRGRLVVAVVVTQFLVYFVEATDLMDTIWAMYASEPSF